MFHRVDDISTLPGPVFFRMAHRIGAYQGVMAIRVAEARDQASGGQQQQRAAPAPRQAPQGVVTAATVDPDLKGLFSFG